MLPCIVPSEIIIQVYIYTLVSSLVQIMCGQQTCQEFFFLISVNGFNMSRSNNYITKIPLVKL